MKPGFLKQKFPALFQEFEEGNVKVVFELVDSLPPESLIANINLVPKAGCGWVIVIDIHGNWEIPGGTREPGETCLETLQRELFEEAGARMVSFQPFGVFRYLSKDKEAYQPHLPHPEFYRVIGVGEVELVETTTDPDKFITQVEVVTLEEAVLRFRTQKRDDLAALYEIAAEIIES